MLITIEELRHWFDEDSATLVTRLQEETGRYGSDEAKVWQRSLQTLTRVLRAPAFQPLHLYFERRGNLALEYQLPGGFFAAPASSACPKACLEFTRRGERRVVGEDFQSSSILRRLACQAVAAGESWSSETLEIALPGNNACHYPEALERVYEEIPRCPIISCALVRDHA